MTEHVERLNASHFDEAMAFLNEVFAVHGPHDFARMLPGVYQPDDEHMQHNLALRRDGRLISIVGVFPVTLHIGAERLRLAGIGGVSVAGDLQGQGHFDRMMRQARDAVGRDGYQLSHLNGRRHRYRRFGWEVTGTDLRCVIQPKNLAHAFTGAQLPSLSLEALSDAPDATLVQRLLELHDSQVIHAERSALRFPRLLRSWHHRALVARDENGDVVGYASGDSEKRQIAELVAASPRHAIAVLRAVAQRWDGKLELGLRALPSELTDELGRIAEHVDLRASGNWQIWDFAAVTAALLRARHAARALPDGRVVVRASGAAECYALWVDGERAGCERIDAAPDLEAPLEELTRILFGPLPPALVRELPRAARALSSWCPLPLGLSPLDQV